MKCRAAFNARNDWFRRPTIIDVTAALVIGAKEFAALDLQQGSVGEASRPDGQTVAAGVSRLLTQRLNARTLGNLKSAICNQDQRGTALAQRTNKLTKPERAERVAN